MKKFEFWAGSFGNGVTICNKAVEKNGEYKTVAHISDAGNVKLYVKAGYIPAADMDKITAWAAEMRENFKTRFEKLPEILQYEKILNAVSISKMVEFASDKRLLPEKLPDMRKYYYSIA